MKVYYRKLETIRRGGDSNQWRRFLQMAEVSYRKPEVSNLKSEFFFIGMRRFLNARRRFPVGAAEFSSCKAEVSFWKAEFSYCKAEVSCAPDRSVPPSPWAIQKSRPNRVTG